MVTHISSKSFGISGHDVSLTYISHLCVEAAVEEPIWSASRRRQKEPENQHLPGLALKQWLTDVNTPAPPPLGPRIPEFP